MAVTTDNACMNRSTSNGAGNACSSSETETIDEGMTAKCAQETETEAEAETPEASSSSAPVRRVRKRPKIAVLPRAVVDQIAAGEVVQRPVSVVKELVENSLDAGATQIVVNFDGLSKLSIVDNGKGISKSDLELLCTRHATSKLQSVDDFEDLSTFGFRGEALASASMVSRLLTVVSRVRFGDYEDDHNEEEQQQQSHSNAMTVAYSQSYKNGAPLQPLPKPCARKVGTTITIEDLFYNVPHRQKAYSKKESEEYGKIHALIQDYSVHYPTVGFVCQRRIRTKRSKQQPQLVVDCNTGQIPAVKELLQSRKKARQSNQQYQQQHGKIQYATKQILSHILESNIANHLLYMECSAQNASEKSPAKEAMESNAKEHNHSNAKNISNSSSDDQPSPSRYEFQYSAEIYFTSPTYHSTPGKGGKPKQGKFILFLNHRLVDLPPLKRALEDVYADLGNPNRNKGSSNNSTNLGKPVLVVNLSVPGCQVDVNVHPSKRQVALMHQEDLIRDVSSKLKDRLEEDGQAFVAQSVKTIVRNPYAKTASKSKKRKRLEDCGNDSVEEDEEENCCSDKDKKEETDAGSSKQPSCRASRTQNTDTEDDQSSNPSKVNTPSSKSNNSSSIHANKTNPKKVAPSKLIRTNSAARAGAIEPFLVSTQISQSQSQQTLSQSTQASETSDSTTEPPSSRSDLKQKLSVFHVPSCPLANPSSSRPPLDMTKPGAFAEQLKREICTCPTEPARRTVLVPKTIMRPKKVTPTPSKYTSIASLRNRVMKQQCFETTSLIRKAFFMGTMSHQRSLVQCDEELVMVNHFEMAKELFYQLALARFGGGAQVAQLGGFGGNGGIHIQTVVAQALQCEDELIRQHEKEREHFKSGSNDNDNNNSNNNDNSGMSLTGMLEVNDSNCNLAQHVTARLVESAPMLDEYFSIRIENQNQDENDQGVDNRSIDDISRGAILTGLPILLDGHCPQPHALPIFLLRLATQVDWTREKHCFHGVCKELGHFYAMLPNESNGNGELNSYVQHQLFPALSYIMLPSKNLTKNGHCTKMTKLSTLYKVFERC